MTFTPDPAGTPELVTAVAFDNLGLSILDPHTDPILGTVPGAATGLTGQDSAMDAQLYNAIAPLALLIDGRTIPTGWEYTLNVTNALMLRPKHWYMRGLMEYPVVPETSLWPANVELSYVRTPSLGVYGGVNSFGWTIGLATCAAICHAWASIIRMWLMKNYPEAVNQYTGTSPDPGAVGTAALSPYYSQNPPPA